MKTMEPPTSNLQPPKPKFPRDRALPVAEEILTRLKPCCERLAIAGSLRRGKAEVGDIEILYVPKMARRPDGLFDERIVSVADEVIEQLFEAGYFAKRQNRLGGHTWGVSNKLAIHVPNGIPVDLFSTGAECWWVSLVVRTGGKETILRLTTGAQRQGATLNAYGPGVTWSDGTVTPATSEEHVFELCGVKYLEPIQR